MQKTVVQGLVHNIFWNFNPRSINGCLCQSFSSLLLFKFYN